MMLSTQRWLGILSVLTTTTGVAGLQVSATQNTTITSATLQTWWHDTGEVNYQTPVQPGNVRQSHLYSAWAQSAADGNGS